MLAVTRFVKMCTPNVGYNLLCDISHIPLYNLNIGQSKRDDFMKDLVDTDICVIRKEGCDLAICIIKVYCCWLPM